MLAVLALLFGGGLGIEVPVVGVVAPGDGRRVEVSLSSGADDVVERYG